MAGDTDERLRRLEERVAGIEQYLLRHAAPPPPPPEPAPAAGTEPRFWGQAQGAPSPVPAAPAGPRVVRTTRAPKADIEKVLGADWLARAGVLVLVLGVVFFFSYAFERDWVPKAGRILIGVVGGLALALLGDVLHRRQKYGAYPQILVAGGAMVTYFSVYAAYAFEDYRAATGMTLELDAMLLASAALALTAYAIARGTGTLASLAAVLGALTSLHARDWTVFSLGYLVFMTAAVGVAALVRRWPFVALVAVLSSHAALLIMVFQDVAPGAVIASAAGLLLVSSAVAARGKRLVPTDGARTEGAVTLLAVFSIGAAWALVLVTFEVNTIEGWAGHATAIAAGTAVLLALLPFAVKEARMGWAAAGIALGLAWAPIQLDGPATAWAWSAALFLGGIATFARSTRMVRIATLVAALLVFGQLVGSETEALASGDLDPAQGLLLYAAALVAGVMAWAGERRADGPASATARLLLAYSLVVPILYLGAALEGFWISIAWAGEAFLVVVLGFVLKQRDLRLAAFGLFALVLGKIFLFDLSVLDLGVRIIVFLVVGAVLLGASFLYARSRTGPTAPQTPRPPR